MDRKFIDCRDFHQAGCTLRISGSEEEVLRTATEHAVSSHGYKNSEKIAESIRRALKPETETENREEDPPTGKSYS